MWSRTPAHAQRAARELRKLRARGASSVSLSTSALEAARGAQCVLSCVSDRAIEGLSKELARAWSASSIGEVRQREAPVALHTSGYHSTAVLDALARAGWPTGTLHPLVPLPNAHARLVDRGSLLRGAWFATTAAGRRRAETARMQRRIIAALEGRELELRSGTSAKQRYHLAAALLSNGAVALFDMALDEMRPAAKKREQAIPALARLLELTARNLAGQGAPGALTGPVVRGDGEVVAGHLARLDRARARTKPGRSPSARPETIVYRLLSERLVDLAQRRGTLSAAQARRMRDLLRR